MNAPDDLNPSSEMVQNDRRSGEFCHTVKGTVTKMVSEMTAAENQTNEQRRKVLGKEVTY